MIHITFEMVTRAHLVSSPKDQKGFFSEKASKLEKNDGNKFCCFGVVTKTYQI